MKYLNNSSLILIMLLIGFSLKAQVPEGYYSSAEGKSGAELKTALFNIIKEPKVVAYSELWKAFEKTDSRKIILFGIFILIMLWEVLNTTIHFLKTDVELSKRG